MATPAGHGAESDPSIHEAIDRDLALLGESANYARWLQDLVIPFLGQRVLEIGAGIGTHSRRLAQGRVRFVATDAEPGYVKRLRHGLADMAHVEVADYGLGQVPPASWSQGFDAVVIMNVLEHVQDDAATLRLLKEVLVNSGCMVLLAPAGSRLFGPLDRAYGHYRRYDRRDGARLASAAGMQLADVRYYNGVGIPGWLLTGLRQTRRLNGGMVRCFDRWIVPWAMRVEQCVEPPFGLGIRIVLRRPTS